MVEQSLPKASVSGAETKVGRVADFMDASKGSLRSSGGSLPYAGFSRIRFEGSFSSS
jgi:hypothetical protein